MAGLPYEFGRFTDMNGVGDSVGQENFYIGVNETI
jgi:hypothetical protein